MDVQMGTGLGSPGDGDAVEEDLLRPAGEGAEAVVEGGDDAGVVGGGERFAVEFGGVMGASDTPDVGVDGNGSVLIEREEADAVGDLLADAEEGAKLLLRLRVRSVVAQGGEVARRQFSDAPGRLRHP